MDKVDVSIIMLTYNHEKFIAEAIGGVRLQQTDLSWELLIADDCSPDGTAEICQKFAGNDVRIRYLRNETNKGANKNFLDTYRKCRGRYIALCEGDDYWTDPLKLQKQINFLSQNKEFVTCFHDVFEWKNGGLIPNSIAYEKDEFDILDLARGNFIQTPSVVFVNLGEKVIPSYFSSIYVGDYTLHMQMARFGKIKFLQDNMAVYRIHEGGGWSTQKEEFMYLKMAQYLEKLLGDEFSREVKMILKRRLLGVYQNLFTITGKSKYLLKLSRLDLLNPVKFLLGRKFRVRSNTKL